MTTKLFILICGGLSVLGMFLIVFFVALAMKKKSDKWLFSITNIRWGIKEFIKMYSTGTSFFSKKRIESSIAFMICMHGSLVALATVVNTIQDFAIWFGLHQPIIFYTVYKIQQEKKEEKTINEIPKA